MTYSFNPEKSIFIDGQWQAGTDTRPNINPSDISENLGNFSSGTAQQVEEAIAAARNAQPSWEAVPMEQKQAILQKIGDELIARCEELGKILALEEGKTFPEGKGEVYRSGQFFHYYAAEVLRQMGDFANSTRPGVTVEVTREAVGVVGVITPWNFPTAIGAWKIAPAIAFGNTVVWKPADLTPASAVALMEIMHKCGVPNGVVNLVLGRGSVVGDAIINSPKINAVSFTGSLAVGKQIASATAQNLVKCQMEMGSKNALYVAPDADMTTAVESALMGSYSGTGQKCTASSRLVVDAKIHDEFVDALTKRLGEIKVGHAMEEGAFMGPVVDEKQLNSNLEWVEKAKASGAECVIGGNRLDMPTEGYYMAPTLFTNTTNDMDINCEEVFAPLACVIKVSDTDEAINVVNDTMFGLTAGIVTNDLKLSTEFKRRAEVGCVMVNLPTAGTDYHVPFGGRKASSFGPREQGSYAKEFYTVVKTGYQKA
ncbi:MAG: aldehyde dehydrogenase family protein [Alphaproteobacteria bacterium]